MSTIIADNLTGKTSAGSITVTSEGGAATQSLQQGLAKCWVNWVGNGTVSISDSLNTSSMTDRGVGKYTANINNAMSNAVYSRSPSGVKNDANEDSNFLCAIGCTSVLPATSSCPLTTAYDGLSLVDFPQLTLTLHGDLA